MADQLNVPSGELTRVNDRIGRTSPFGQFEFHTVQFSSTPDVDLAIRHQLRPLRPDDICYIVVQQSFDGIIYHDMTFSRRKWTNSTIYLRSNTASLSAVLLLFVPAIPITSLVASL